MPAVVIEPSRLYQGLITRTLDITFNMETAGFNNGAEALDYIVQSSVEFICIAMHLPDMTGIDVAQQVRQMGERFEHIPILMITSECNPDTLTQALIAGVTDIMRKDESESLADRIQALLPASISRQSYTGKILYLEDSQTVANIMVKKVAQIGIDMECASNVAEAVQMANDNHYDIFITDIVLNESLTGVDFIKIIKQNEALAHTPILALTGEGDVSRRIATIKAGANDCITKPVIDEELFARINNLFSIKSLYDQLDREKSRLAELAVTDSLTSLYNRHYLAEASNRKVAEAYRDKKNLSLLVMDVDDFKNINDSHGHVAGDTVLKDISSRFKKYFSDAEIVARFGGEEFVVIMPECDIDKGAKRADEIRAEIATSQKGELPVTVSIGMAELDIDSEENFDALFKRADAALYAAKTGGKNRVSLG